MNNTYETVIGLEIHAELSTKTKIFCSCKTDFGAPPNSQCCPVCMGMPGTLPTLNQKAVEYAVRAGLATNCEISLYSRFDRKNYFYPDLPKGYQITQYEFPICKNGYLDIDTDLGKKRIRITRIHLEEDAGKLIHDSDCGTLVDCNRCGVPLIEIVTEPDIRSSGEAEAFLRTLRSVLMFAGVSDCRMNEGSFRCDINVSVRKIGDSTLGTRSEIKNLNSFSFVTKAIEYEHKRQTELIASSGRVKRETRRFDESDGKTYSMRSKEEENDYRFFEEPDIPALILRKEDIERIKKELPMLPDERMKLYLEEYRLTSDTAKVILSDICLAGFFEKAAKASKSPRTTANILVSDILSYSNEGGFSSKIQASQLAVLSDLFFTEQINSSTQKKLIKRMWEEGIDPILTVREEDLLQINDADILSAIVDEVILENPKCVEDIRRGKTAATKTVIGKAMAKSLGKANPRIINEIVASKFKNEEKT